ncbi:MAG: hypothetical protein COU29_00435 [Candidatus Magasanikbacteria bacterium CG10_big_fil_rev_8_21_14_0_10_36_32]|uniref:Bacterial Ig-like domain-containing protein n=1 Tax=Candidatus Magasanikbacteria bacterium CG10_big_fil_rev_8_21_14_0_10_36_32 TaxID=1974646 RepID=A0A2M6W7E8_9BACT|nr:MAG: hypothetical protein COU29_00435 [Candidatus Magasanikbacteria bacterium CG10_big_fil_rev_8_21_14_0_10_36_32]
MKIKWLNLVLWLTNKVYTLKKNLVERTGLIIIVTVIKLLILEVVLAIISLPLYLGLKTKTTAVYLAEKSGFGQVAFDYRLRRLLTLTGVGVIFLIWTVKLILIISVPRVYGQLQLYKVVNFQSGTGLSQQLIKTETDIQTAKISNKIIVPVIENVTKTGMDSYAVSGSGQSFSTVAVMLTGQQTIIYTIQADNNGYWTMIHNQKNFRLNDGNHSLLAFTYDKKTGQRSDISPEQFFKVKTSLIDRLVKNIDTLTNWSVVIVILLGLFLTILTI